VQTTHLSLRLLAVSLLATPAVAQWSNDALLNQVAADRAGEQTQPKLVATPDGGFYLSWFDSDPAGTPAFGYDVYLQRFDSGGVEQWAHNGVLVADRGFSSTVDYDLSIDTAGNALLTFRDDRQTGVQVAAAKVDPGGVLVWGAAGVQLTSTTDFVANPKIAGTSDGNAVVAWIQDSSVHVLELAATGATVWTPELVLTPAAGGYSTSDLDASDAGATILEFVHETGGFGAPRHVLAQKLDTNGGLTWGAGHVTVFDGGSLQFGNFPGFVPDGAGGAVFAWYSSSPALESRAQRLDATGAELFPHDGVAVSTNGAQLRVSPAVSFDATTQSTYVFYVEKNGAQSQCGLSGQRFDATGIRQWGATGLALVALGATPISNVRSLVLGDRVSTYWIAEPALNQDVGHAAVLDASGSLLAPIVDLATSSSIKFRLVAESSSFGFAGLAWRDERGGDPDVYVQNMLPGGELGGTATSAFRNGAGGNVAFYTSVTDARLGASWVTEVSHAHHPGALATLILGRTAPAAGALLGPGEILIGGAKLFKHSVTSSGTSDLHSLPVPVELAFVGLTAYTQALIIGGGAELGNAIDATAGL
jgi:hypothetical protein